MMDGAKPDGVDKRLLNLLQENARYTATDLADKLGVSDNTVHNRMERLEKAGIISGYSANIDVKKTGLRLFFHFTCTARISERSRIADEVITIPEVLEVTELMTGMENLHIKVVGTEDEDITRIAERLDDYPLEINDENLIRAEHTEPLNFVDVSELIEKAE